MTTVDSFSLRLESYPEMLRAAHPVRYVEERLLQQLSQPVRLLRWAIVAVECDGQGTAFRCEGAYLKSCQEPGRL